MLRLLSKIFAKQNQIEEHINASLQMIYLRSLDELFLKYFNESSYFKDGSFEMVIKHLKNEINLNKSGENLTVNEKNALGLNTRLSITSNLVSVLSPEGLQLPNPKDALKQVYYRAKFERIRLEKFLQLLSVGITEATYHSCKDERDCAWCKANDGVKFIISEDLNNKINQNCTCEWNRGIFSPEVNSRK